MSLVEILFIGVGVLAVAAAVGMLLTKKAVHSALFLIANFICVAVIYLMLDAPFLAMVQIAVYAGAIMVLFLFVIMLLGAENPRGDVRDFKWFTPTTLLLSLGFLGIVALVLLASNINNTPSQSPPARLRVVNAMSVYPQADFYLGDQVFMQNVAFAESDGSVLRFVQVEPGTYAVGVNLAGTRRRPLPLGTVTIKAGETVTLVAYGAPGTDVLPRIVAVPEDVSAAHQNIGRFTVVNVHVPPRDIAIVDAGPDRLISGSDEASTAPVIVETLGLGEYAQLDDQLPGGRNWVITDAARRDEVILRLSSGDSNSPYRIEGGKSQLLVFTTDRQGEFVVDRAVNVVTPHDYAFGSPQALGASLFVDYVLPFQMVGILLLAAMVGAIVVAQRTVAKPKPGRPTRRKVSRPLTSVITSQTGTSVFVDDEIPQLTAPEETAEPVGN